jgi:hypothetical protein
LSILTVLTDSVNVRDFSGYFTLGPGSGEIGKNRDISKKLGIFKFDWLLNANVHWLKIRYNQMAHNIKTKFKMHASKLLFQFYNTVTVTIEVYIQTHCHDHHIQSWFARTEWYNNGIKHAWQPCYFCIGRDRETSRPSHPHSVYWINAHCWLFTKDFFLKTESIIFQDEVFLFFPNFLVQYLLLMCQSLPRVIVRTSLVSKSTNLFHS